MHIRAAVAVFDAEASNKIVTGKVTSNRSMSRPFPTAAYWYAGFCVGQRRIEHIEEATDRTVKIGRAHV